MQNLNFHLGKILSSILLCLILSGVFSQNILGQKTYNSFKKKTLNYTPNSKSDGELAKATDFSKIPQHVQQKADKAQQEIMAYLLQALAHSKNPSAYKIGRNNLATRFLPAISQLSATQKDKMQKTALRVLNSSSEKQQLLGSKLAKINFRQAIYPQISSYALIKANNSINFNAPKTIPFSGSASGQLEVNVRKVKLIDETDGFLGSELGEDEIYLGALFVNAENQASKINPFHVADFDEDGRKTKNYDPAKLLKNFVVAANKNNQTFHATFVLFEKDGRGMYNILSIALDELAKLLKEYTSGVSLIAKKAIDKIVDFFAGDDVFPSFTHSQTINANTNSFTKNYWFWTRAHGGKYNVYFQWKYNAPPSRGNTDGNIVVIDEVSCEEDIFNMPSNQTQNCFNHWTSKGKWPIGISINEDLKVMESFQTGRNRPSYALMTKQVFLAKYEQYKRSMRPDKVDVVNTPQGLRYSCVWTPVDGRFLTFIDMSHSTFQKKWRDYRKQGYVVVDLHGYSRNNQVFYAATWVQRNHTNYATYFNLSFAAYQEKYQTMSQKGYYPTRFSAYKTANGLRYAANWEKKAGIFVHKFGIDLQEVKAKNADYKRQGYRLYHFQAYDASNGNDLYSAIWHKPPKTPKTVRNPKKR